MSAIVPEAGVEAKKPSVAGLIEKGIDENKAGSVRRPSYFTRALSTLVYRGRVIISTTRKRQTRRKAHSATQLIELAEALLSRRGDASGVGLARRLLDAYASANATSRVSFLRSLANHFGPDLDRVKKAAEGFIAGGTAESAQSLHAAAEPRRQELIRRLNLASEGTLALIRMREELLANMTNHRELRAVDADMHHLFAAWFNRGFLSVRTIDWKTPAHILEKLIKYEAVHQIQDWNDLRRRTEPADRRCFAFFHPCLPDEPLIFVEVALTREIPGAIGPLLAADRESVSASQANTAVFYSISNCQKGLKGISFGHFLIKQVAEELRKELPSVRRFVTLSPIPGFSSWLEKERANTASTVFPASDRDALTALSAADWYANRKHREDLKEPLVRAAAHYFLVTKGKDGRPVDPVAKFHLGNGARLERLNVYGDMSLKGIKQSMGMMVNYLYELQDVERNHEEFANTGRVVASMAVRRILGRDSSRSGVQ